MVANFCAEVTVTLAMTLRGRNQACRKGSEECVPVHLCDDIASDSQIPSGIFSSQNPGKVEPCNPCLIF